MLYCSIKQGRTDFMINLFKRKCKNNVKVDLILKQNSFSLENQDGKNNEIESIDIEYGLQDLFNHKNQYIILTSPDIQNNIRFIQACMIKNSVEVQILYQDTTPQLLYKLCSQEECWRIFLDFYDNVFIPNLKEYKPVQIK